ncbi:hypothetical protein [Cyclobacterium jeungdonense]|uniref:TonB protein C-terminal n=1 Tax=Cyclobacterium jeungdonense TaxID=708087 RepID=A0ABT8CBV5_9BACT|nr:hypothetical protein [Cyclobacterium jeungdonense]MDN3689429.1 hypothetical protein [Cyclobacterium jeungdonense]
MHSLLLIFIILAFSCFPIGVKSQSKSDYTILKTNNAYVVKTEAKDYTRINTEVLSLECSSTSLSQELNFEKISSYFDDDSKTIFRNIKAQARIYLDIQGEVRDIYFICESDPEKHGVDFSQLEKAIRRKIRVVENEACLPKFEDQYISWYIPLYQY